jgi:hypothetical protein
MELTFGQQRRDDGTLGTVCQIWKQVGTVPGKDGVLRQMF